MNLSQDLARAATDDTFLLSFPLKCTSKYTHTAAHPEPPSRLLSPLSFLLLLNQQTAVCARSCYVPTLSCLLISLEDEDVALLCRHALLPPVQHPEAFVQVGHVPDSPLNLVEDLFLHLHAREIVVHLRDGAQRKK